MSMRGPLSTNRALILPASLSPLGCACNSARLLRLLWEILLIHPRLTLILTLAGGVMSHLKRHTYTRAMWGVLRA